MNEDKLKNSFNLCLDCGAVNRKCKHSPSNNMNEEQKKEFDGLVNEQILSGYTFDEIEAFILKVESEAYLRGKKEVAESLIEEIPDRVDANAPWFSDTAYNLIPIKQHLRAKYLK